MSESANITTSASTNSSEESSPLYPYDPETGASYLLEVGEGHCLYVEESGNPAGVPVVFLHGGPGSSCKPYHRGFFNPEKYRIILFDQRGSGKSLPNGELAYNTTQNLISDLEKIRDFLKIKQWILFGGSWGATLALAYAQSFPEVVLGLVVRGTFLARTKDIWWFYRNGGVNQLFPEAWQRFIAAVPNANPDFPLPAYYAHLTGKNRELQQQAALAWANWGGAVISFAQFPELTQFEQVMLHGARIEAHYMMNRCFLNDNQILKEAMSLRNIKGVIIHGQRDLVCPLDNAWSLKQHWQSAELKVLAHSGHLATGDNEMMKTLVETMDNF